MMANFVTRSLALVLGYAYPAYECFKTVELNKPEIEQLRFWCQYWILVAALTVFERVGESFISWLPMYSEAKLAFLVYLWCPKTKGTAYVYETFLRPYVAKHENEIDRNLLELRARAGDIVVQYWQTAASSMGRQGFLKSCSTLLRSHPRSHQDHALFSHDSSLSRCIEWHLCQLLANQQSHNSINSKHVHHPVPLRVSCKNQQRQVFLHQALPLPSHQLRPQLPAHPVPKPQLFPLQQVMEKQCKLMSLMLRPRKTQILPHKRLPWKRRSA